MNKRGFETWLVMAIFILCAVPACSKMDDETPAPVLQIVAEPPASASNNIGGAVSGANGSEAGI